MIKMQLLIGMMLHLNFPNAEEVVGYFLSLSDSKLHFKPLEEAGEKVFKDGEKHNWMTPFPKFTEQKIVILPFY